MHLYYTLNNKRPDPFQAYGEKFTRKFDYPFTLSPGKKTIKVMAMAADKSKESSVVTRTFIVHEGEKKDKDADVSLVLIDVHVLSNLNYMYMYMQISDILRPFSLIVHSNTILLCHCVLDNFS